MKERVDKATACQVLYLWIRLNVWWDSPGSGLK